MPANFWDDEFAAAASQGDFGGRNFYGQTATVLPDGRIVVTWTASNGEGDDHFGDFHGAIRGRILNPDGSPAGASFLVNSTTENGPDGATVTTLTDGRFVVAWHSHENGDGGSGGNQTIRARVFNADGTPAIYNGSSNDFVVNTAARFEDILPRVVAVSDGGFVIAWQSPTAPFGFHDISMRVFTNTGPAAGPQQAISLNDDHSGEPAMTALADGRYIVGWRSHMGGVDDMVARIFNADGTPAAEGGAQFTLSTTTQGDQFHLDLTTLSDGRFVAVWSTNTGSDGEASDGDGPGIRARVFNADGTADLTVNGGNDFLVNTTIGNEQTRPQVAALADGRFFISFSSKTDPEGNFEDNILGRLFNADGTPDGSDFVISEGSVASGGAYSLPNDLVLTPDGRVLSIHRNNPQRFNDIIGRFLDFGTGGESENGTDGNDTLIGTFATDTLTGGLGADQLFGGGGGDTLNGGAGGDLLSGGGGGDALHGGDGADFVLGGAGNDTLDGDNEVDTLIGGTGNDTLGGGEGADFMLGGEGDDIYHVNDTFDLVDEDVVFAGYGHGGLDIVVSTANWFWDVYSIAERVIIAEDASDPSGAGTTIVGSVFSNEMTGNTKNNVLFGRGGSDTYRAGDGVDFISLSTLGLTDQNAYVGVDGPNTIIVDERTSGPFSYDIIFEFESGKDKIDVSDYGYASAEDVLAQGVDDGAGNSYFILGDGLDYLYMVGLTKDQLAAGDFII